MFLRVASWLWLLSGLLLCLPRQVNGQWVRNAWIRKYRCDGHSWTHVTFGTTPFWIDSLRGQLDTVNGSTQLSLSILAVHDTALFGCDELDLTALERSLQLKVLGKYTGQIVRLKSTCPLPITPDLTPHVEGHRFSTFQVDYQLEHGHKLQTLAAEYDFRKVNGQELDCAAAKVTPYIGTPYAVAFNLVPAGVMALVGAAAWQTHAAELGVDHFVDFSSALVSHQGPVWDTIMDIGVYLRYLQFAFLSSSLSIEYPGFLPPIASNLAWSSLMFWRGPYDGGLTWPGVEQGIYVSNATFGMDYMVRMLGFPRIMDFMFDAFLNLVILVGALLAILGAVHMLASRWNPEMSSRGVHTPKLAYMSVEVCLSLFSMPLLAYMSNDLMLMGYLPKYRVGLVALTILVLLYVHYIITRPFLHSQRSTELSNEFQYTSKQTISIRGALKSLLSYIPHFMPLLQAIAVGALQSWGYVQTIVLFAAEAAILVHAAMSKKAPFRFSRSHTVFLCAFRLITISMLIPLALLIDEAPKQSIGYVILCLHGIVIIPGFLATSTWRLYLVTRRARYGSGISSRGRSDEQNDSPSRINLDDLSTSVAIRDRTYGRLGQRCQPSIGRSGTPIHSRRASPGESLNLRYQSQSYSHFIAGPSTTPEGQHIDQRRDFYRRPRSRVSTPEAPHSSSSASPSLSSGGCDIMPSPLQSAASESEQRLYAPQLLTQLPLHGLDALSEIRPQVDYSFREADLFYGTPANDDSTQDALHSVSVGHTSCESLPRSDTEVRAAAGKKPQSWRSVFSATWTKLSSALAQPQQKEEGFQVVRPGNAALRMARMQQAQARAQAQAQGIRLGHIEAENSDAPRDDVPTDIRGHGSALP